MFLFQTPSLDPTEALKYQDRDLCSRLNLLFYDGQDGKKTTTKYKIRSNSESTAGE